MQPDPTNPVSYDFESVRRRARRQLGLLWGGAALALVVISPLASRLTFLLPGCPFKAWTGWPCPACGATRAAFALSKLELWHAFSHYPLATVGWIFLIGGGLSAGIWTLSGRLVPEVPRSFPTWLTLSIALAVLANWIYSIATGV